MISIICCANNLEVYRNMLLESLENQNEPYEVILIDNTFNKHKSAAEALNFGARQAKGDYLVFAHQDIQFNNLNFLRNIKSYINRLNGIVGLAGIKDSQGVLTNLTQGEHYQNGGEHKIDSPVEVQTLDEVFIACRKEVYELIKFDEKICNDWHLYGVDFCLSAKKIGIQSFVVPEVIHHKSGGKISLGYVKTLYRLIEKHRKSYTKIYTTCSITSTSRLRSTQYIVGLIWDHVITK